MDCAGKSDAAGCLQVVCDEFGSYPALLAEVQTLLMRPLQQPGFCIIEHLQASSGGPVV